MLHPGGDNLSVVHPFALLYCFRTCIIICFIKNIQGSVAVREWGWQHWWGDGRVTISVGPRDECQYYESECVSQGGKDFSFGAAMMGKIARL